MAHILRGLSLCRVSAHSLSGSNPPFFVNIGQHVGTAGACWILPIFHSRNPLSALCRQTKFPEAGIQSWMSGMEWNVDRQCSGSRYWRMAGFWRSNTQAAGICSRNSYRAPKFGTRLLWRPCPHEQRQLTERFLISCIAASASLSI
jgi:hypothetical protein